VSEFAALLAAKIGMAEESVHRIRYAAPLHDIGKIGIPENVLLKPGRLDPDEWEIMKLHTVIGGKILEESDTDYLEIGEIIALTHHEKWNGKGYPKGLEKEKIPIEGRITAIVDVFDAITSNRPYREPISHKDAIQYINNEKGSHFDPDLVEAFLGIKDEILSIKTKLKDQEDPIVIRLCSEAHPKSLLNLKNETADQGSTDSVNLDRASRLRKSDT
jgi:putative two-component system response regulator